MPVRHRRQEKKKHFSVSTQSHSLFSASFQAFCLTARAYLNTQKYGLFCSLIQLQLLHSPTGIFFIFSFKTIANSNRQIRRPCADTANEFTRLISLINFHLAFSFFHFSKTTLLQLGINKFVFYQGPKLYNPLNTDVVNSQKCL